jgi:hypothetical protein
VKPGPWGSNTFCVGCTVVDSITGAIAFLTVPNSPLLILINGQKAPDRRDTLSSTDHESPTSFGIGDTKKP